MPGLAEEAPQAYTNVSCVVETVSQADIAHKVARLRPIAVVSQRLKQAAIAPKR